MKKILFLLAFSFSLMANAIVTPTVTITDNGTYLIILETNKAPVAIAKPFTVVADPGDVVLLDLYNVQKVVYLTRLQGWTFTSSVDLQAQLMALNPVGTQTLSINGYTLSISGGNYVTIPGSSSYTAGKNLVLNSANTFSVVDSPIFSGATTTASLVVTAKAELPAGSITYTMLATNLRGTQSIAYSATPTWNLASGSVATMTLTGNITSLSISNPQDGMTGTLILKQDATGSRTLGTLPTTSKVVSGGAGAITLTTTANAIDIITFIYLGGVYFWTYGKNYN